MKTIIALSLVTAVAAVPCAAQTSWTGGYVGGQAGQVESSGGDGSTILFDTNLDGQFGENVNTAAGANAFSPGFCNGGANGRTPSEGCEDDDRDEDFGARLGYDWQVSNVVFGVVGEYGQGKARDSVAAFSTTPASYTMTRELDSTYAVRGRVGLSFGGNNNLLYATAGYAWAKVENSFRTTNTANTFTDNGDSDAKGPQYGGGYERRLGAHFTLGAEYLFSKLEDDEYRVRAQGPAPVTNPFILVNAAGTDFRRGDDDFELESLRVTLNYRF